MTTAMILNVVLAIFVFAAILSLLGWGIVTDNSVAASRSGGATDAARGKAPQPAPRQAGPVLDLSAY
jgi:hypothetical protein